MVVPNTAGYKHRPIQSSWWSLMGISPLIPKLSFGASTHPSPTTNTKNIYFKHIKCLIQITRKRCFLLDFFFILNASKRSWCFVDTNDKERINILNDLHKGMLGRACSAVIWPIWAILGQPVLAVQWRLLQTWGLLGVTYLYWGSRHVGDTKDSTRFRHMQIPVLIKAHFIPNVV